MSNKEALLDNLDEVSLALESKFKLKEIKLNSNFQWSAKFEFEEHIPKSYHRYKLALKLDEEPYNNELERYAWEIKNHQENPSLLPSTDQESIKTYEKFIEECKADLETARKENPTIEFVVRTSEIKYKDNNTVIVFDMPDRIINVINDHKMRFAAYTAELDPSF